MKYIPENVWPLYWTTVSVRTQHHICNMAYGGGDHWPYNFFKTSVWKTHRYPFEAAISLARRRLSEPSSYRTCPCKDLPQCPVSSSRATAISVKAQRSLIYGGNYLYMQFGELAFSKSNKKADVVQRKFAWCYSRAVFIRQSPSGQEAPIWTCQGAANRTQHLS